MKTVRIKLLSPASLVPDYQTPGSACFDISSVAQGTVMPGSAESFPTGLAFEVPVGHVLLVFSRSGMGVKQGVRLANTTGVIDSDFRGELMVSLHNDSTRPFAVEIGQRIAQAMLVPIPEVRFSVVDELSETWRGTGGLGSTGSY